MKKGAFEKFRSDWLLQVAADRGAKAAAPVAIVLAFKHLNRLSGACWPAIETLAGAIGADATNTVRNALQTLELRGHLRVRGSKGGRKQTNIFMPLVAGKPFKKLKGSETEKPFNSMEGFDDVTEADFSAETLQIVDGKPFKKLKGSETEKPFNSMEGFDDVTEADFSAETLQIVDGKPFKKLKGNHLIEPSDRESPPPGGFPPTSIRTGEVTDDGASGADAHERASGLRINRADIEDRVIPPAASPEDRARILDELTRGTRSRLDAKKRIGDLLDRGQLTPRLAQQIADRSGDEYEQTA